MDAVLRAAAIYLFMLVIFRVTGKRSLAQITTFDFVLLLIIAETTQQALLGNDFSITNTMILVTTLLGMELAMTYLKEWIPRAVDWLDGMPLVLVENGEMLTYRMEKARVNKGDILSAARETQGLERMDQIKYAVLEQHGGISIVPAG